MSFSEILNILLGGGIIALIVNVATMRSTVRKANAEAEKAKADAETVRITNTDNATRVLVDNIVKPLREELHATRRELQETKQELQETKQEMASTKGEMTRLRKAVEATSDCRHSDDCPVRRRLRDNQKETSLCSNDDNETRSCDRDNADSKGQRVGEDNPIRGQPP